ncbi:MAG: hypothetical protein JWN17_1259, partial [Frankiales bacterium]|nr:hypothetical protein [Frankiales bacterium]
MDRTARTLAVVVAALPLLLVAPVPASAQAPGRSSVRASPAPSCEGSALEL